jgi:hypothetical protein
LVLECGPETPRLARLLRFAFYPFSHGVGYIGHALLGRQIAKQNFNYKNFEKLFIPRKLSCEYIFSEGVPLKNIILCLFSKAKDK